MKKRKWFARVIWQDQEGGIVEEHVFKTKAEAMIFKEGFESGRLHLTDEMDLGPEQYFVDVTTRFKLRESV